MVKKQEKDYKGNKNGLIPSPKTNFTNTHWNAKQRKLRKFCEAKFKIRIITLVLYLDPRIH